MFDVLLERLAKQWDVVFAFFHPELKDAQCEQLEKADFDLSKIIDGLMPEAAGIASDEKRRKTSAFGYSPQSSLYSGVPAFLVYEAYGAVERTQYWRAQIEIISGVAVGETVVVNVTDADGVAIEDATLILLGSPLRVAHGLAAYNLSEFQQNLSNTEVRLIRDCGVSVLGTLKFGDDMFN